MKEQHTIISFLQSRAAEKPVSFHMPGHKGAAFYRRHGYGAFLDCMMDCDITEIAGADNLFQPEGIIRKTMDRYRRLYGTKESFLLINGSSAGLIAAVAAAVPAGGRLIMARNCHKSVFSGAALAGVRPVYAYPELISEYGISGEVTAEEIRRCLAAYPDSSAVIVTSPNYYGICSDIKAIAEACHEAGKILIVDQAHGAHLKFFDTYIHEELYAAESLGADLVISSTHKTLASFTQSAVANLCTDRISAAVYADCLQRIESSSPSYLLMASLEINAAILEREGRQLIEDWNRDLDYFYSAAAEIPGLRLIRHPMMDRTKICMDMSAYGLDGRRLEELLTEQGIFVELVTGDILMCLTGIGNRRCDYEQLISALIGIAESRVLKTKEKRDTQFFTAGRPALRAVPAEAEMIPAGEAAGRVCAASIVPYPPGIPLFCPGEIMDGETLAYAVKLRENGGTVIGIDGLGRVGAGKK